MHKHLIQFSFNSSVFFAWTVLSLLLYRSRARGRWLLIFAICLIYISVRCIYVHLRVAEYAYISTKRWTGHSEQQWKGRNVWIHKFGQREKNQFQTLTCIFISCQRNKNNIPVSAPRKNITSETNECESTNQTNGQRQQKINIIVTMH